MSKFRSMYSANKSKVAINFPEAPVMQSGVAECDINKIVSKANRLGVMPESARQAAMRYGDFSAIPSFQEMQDRVIAAHELFASLPAKARKALHNDPQELMDLVANPEGGQRLVELGLAEFVRDLPPDAGVAADVSPAGQAGKGGTEPPVSGGKPDSSGKSKKVSKPSDE